MASNWQYATLSAGERLSRIRDGEYDIYTQEIARANEVIKNRKELGLDISEQLAWIKKLDYVKTNNGGLGGTLTPEEIDYNTKMGKTFTTTTQSNNAIANLQSVANFNSANIANATNANNSGNTSNGINSSNIGSIINNSNSGINANNTITSPANIPNAPQLPAYTSTYSSYNFEEELKAFVESQKKRRDELEETLQKELTEKYGILDTYYGQLNTAVEEDTIGKKSDYYANAVSRLPSMYEKFANSGLSFDGGKVRSEQMSYNNALNKSLATLDAQAINAVNSNNLSKVTERSKAYSDYTTRLSQENSRLDDMEYQMIRDIQDNSYKQNQFSWEQYKYSTQYEFDKYKYEQQLRETAEQKTLEQQRWEKEFQFKLSAQEFDQLLRNQQLTLETDRYLFDVDKYNKEYSLKLQDYDLKLQQYYSDLNSRQQDYDLKLQQYYSDLNSRQQDYDLKLQQYYSDLGFKQQDYDLRAQEFNLKVDLAEFNKMLDNLKYTFDVDKFEREYALKQSSQQYSQNFDAEKFAFEIEKFYKEYEMKQQQYNSDYEYKTQQSQTQSAQWEREMALKEAVQKSNMTQAEKDYALKYLELEKKYTQTPTSSTSASSSNSSSSSSKAPASTSSNTATNTSSTSQSSVANTTNTNTTNSNSSATNLYQTALTTAMWMKTQYTTNGKNTIRKFSNNDIDNWINTLQLSAADKAKLKKAIGI